MSVQSRVTSQNSAGGDRRINPLSFDQTVEPIYRDDSAQRLCLHIVEGELDITAFRVLAQARQRFGEHIGMTAAIIGGSHAIRYEVGTLIWYELFACAAPKGEQKRLYSARLEALTKPVELALDGRTRYTFSATVSDSTTGETALQRVKKQAKDSDGMGLMYHFPTTAKLPIAQTIVSVRRAFPQPAVIVETVHSYPNEGTMVLTRAETHHEAVGKGL